MPRSPLTPRTRQRRIISGRQRFEELKRQRIQRMREDLADDALADAETVQSLLVPPFDEGESSSQGGSLPPSDVEDNNESGDDVDLEFARITAVPTASPAGSASASKTLLTPLPTNHADALNATLSALRRAEAARAHAEEERMRAEGLLELARDEHREMQQQLSEQLSMATSDLSAMAAEVEHYRARACTLQESETSLLTKLQVKRKRIAAAERNLEQLQREMARRPAAPPAAVEAPPAALTAAAAARAAAAANNEAVEIARAEAQAAREEAERARAEAGEAMVATMAARAEVVSARAEAAAAKADAERHAERHAESSRAEAQKALHEAEARIVEALARATRAEADVTAMRQTAASVSEGAAERAAAAARWASEQVAHAELEAAHAEADKAAAEARCKLEEAEGERLSALECAAAERARAQQLASSLREIEAKLQRAHEELETARREVREALLPPPPAPPSAACKCSPRRPTCPTLPTGA